MKKHLPRTNHSVQSSTTISRPRPLQPHYLPYSQCLNIDHRSCPLARARHRVGPCHLCQSSTRSSSTNRHQFSHASPQIISIFWSTATSLEESTRSSKSPYAQAASDEHGTKTYKATAKRQYPVCMGHYHTSHPYHPKGNFGDLEAVRRQNMGVEKTPRHCSTSLYIIRKQQGPTVIQTTRVSSPGLPSFALS